MRYGCRTIRSCETFIVPVYYLRSSIKKIHFYLTTDQTLPKVAFWVQIETTFWGEQQVKVIRIDDSVGLIFNHDNLKHIGEHICKINKSNMGTGAVRHNYCSMHFCSVLWQKIRDSIVNCHFCLGILIQLILLSSNTSLTIKAIFQGNILAVGFSLVSGKFHAHLSAETFL